MELSLTNFRSWEEKTFNFSDNGIVLVTGRSGSGKSTIFHAINFAMYGKGTKLQTIGKTSCKVILKWRGMKIQRTKRPNQLIVNDLFEDEAGQDLINEKFGNSINFIQQKAIKSFLSLSPAEKLSFLEKEVIPGDVKLLKQKVSTKIREIERDIDTLKGEIKVCEEFLEDGEELEIVQFPCEKHKKTKKRRDLFMRNETTRMKNCMTKKKKLLRLNEKLLRQIVSSREEKSKKERLTQIHSDIELMEIRIKEKEQLVDTQDPIYQLKQYEKQSRLYDKYEASRKSLAKLKEQMAELPDNNPIDELKLELDKIDGYIELKREELRLECEKKKYYTTQENIDLIKKQLTLLEQEKENIDNEILSLSVKTCPSCSVKLRNVDGNLVIFGDSVTSRNKKDLVTKQLMLKKKIGSTRLSLSGALSNFERYNKLLEKEVNSVENSMEELKESRDKIAETISIEKDIHNQRKRLTTEIKTLENMVPIEYPDDNTDHLHEQIKISSELSEIKRSLRKLKLKVSETNISEIIESEEELEAKISLNKDKVTEQEQEYKSHKSNILRAEKYERYVELKEKQLKWETKLGELQNSLSNQIKRHTASLELKKIILEAESISLKKYVQTINIHVQHYLDLFFRNDPISVKLKTTKEVGLSRSKKVKKMQINIEVRYKGMEIDLNSISGGEYDRVQLAYILALADLSNSPLIMLDESISSLDENTCCQVLESIRNKNRLTLIVSHQITSGLFDQIEKTE